MLRNGQGAPEFTLTDHQGEPRSLQQLRDGKCLVLLFFRFAGCPTSRRDLLRYANVAGRMSSVGTNLAAICVEPPDSNGALARKLDLGFPVLSDPRLEVSKAWGVYIQEESGEDPAIHGEPAVFVIDIDGKIAYSQVNSGPKGLADPAEIALVSLYMSQNSGRY